MRQLYFLFTFLFCSLCADEAHDVFKQVKADYDSEQWSQVVQMHNVMLEDYSDSPFLPETYFYAGMARYKLGYFRPANNDLTAYLNESTNPKYFDEAIEAKFAIAESRKVNDEMTIEIYDEISTAIPLDELAAKSLYGKGLVQYANADYRESVETFQLLIRRFPKHTLAVDSFLAIGKVYETQARLHFADPNFLDQARSNLQKFTRAFPGEERLGLAKNAYMQMEEFYAEKLFKTAQFYEKKKSPESSQIYYTQIVNKYPETQVAEKSRKRLAKLTPKECPADESDPN